jgi:hypothetical protein
MTTIIENRNELNGLGLAPAIIPAVTAVVGAVMSYNKGIEQERIAYNKEWSLKMESAAAERDANIPRYEEGERALILEQYKGLQAGLQGLGGIDEPKKDNTALYVFGGLFLIGVTVVVISQTNTKKKLVKKR